MERDALLLASAAVVGVACAKLGSAIGDDSAVMVGGRSFRGDLVDMKTTLEGIGVPLKDAKSWTRMRRWCDMKSTDEELEMRSTGEEWVRRVKNAAYDIWDMLDDLQANNTTPPAANTIRTGMLTRLAIVPKATNKIAIRTNTMRDDLNVILQESPSFGSDNWSSDASERLLHSERPEPHIVEETIITGRDEDKQRIVLAVLSAVDDIREAKGTIILPIVGLPTIGKTILAKLVYIDTRFKDYSKVWVCAWANFDLLKMGKSIISLLSGAVSKDSNDMEFIMERLNELLGGKKKVLVVLCDLWEHDISKLESLRRMLSPSDKGSKVIVIVTTRMQDTAEAICTLPPYRLYPLSDDRCWTIIKQASDFEARADKQELEQIGREIAYKCMGSPLAAQALGYMLRSKDLRAWSMLLNNSIWNVCRGYRLQEFSALALCYQDMPPSLRLCFAYCAIFPRGHSIARDELIHQWIALGFIEPSDRFSTTQLAEEYITTLLGMSFLEPTKSASVSY